MRFATMVPLSLRALILLIALACAVPAGAAPIVVPIVTSSGGLFEYNYAISSDALPPEELILVTIAVPADDPDIVATLTAPMGFTFNYEPFFGLVDFVKDSASFTAAPITGFMFSSAFAPGPTTFDALYSSQTDSRFESGTTVGPSAVLVPEPSSGGLLALALVVFRRRCQGYRGRA
jgi:hypothetical protein